ncbi:MAG TPA: metallophosphoesterase family protein [Planctomycetota bacterium]|nr:metallophosphoesterase family protein [Planctomycetota bacterium]
MKLALISDVHGNLEALDAVLADIDRRDPDSQLVCAGDVVGYGPDPEACIARLRDRKAPCVIGNHEEMVLGRRDFSRCVHSGIVAAVWTRTHVSASAREYLESLPPKVEAAPGVVVCHGNLASADTYVSTPDRAAEALEQLRNHAPDAAVLVCGHTHHAVLYTREGGFDRMRDPGDRDLAPGVACLINPGAVGQAREGTRVVARYAVLDLDRRRVSFREVAYDHATTLRKMRAAKLVAQVILLPPTGLRRWVEGWKTRWARYRASR